MDVIITCERCGDNFCTVYRKKKTKRFCSTRCLRGNVAGEQTTICVTCSLTFTYVKVRGIKRFCSETCQNRNEVLRRHNINQRIYDLMLIKQNFVCAICEGDPGQKGFHIDHDHTCCPSKGSCGECVRSLLCGLCNAGLGNFRDSPELLNKAILYLKETK